LRIIVTLDNPPLVDWLRKKLAEHEVLQGSAEEGGLADMLICGPSPGGDIEESLAAAEAQIKETKPVIFVLHEDSAGLKSRLQEIGAPAGWIVTPLLGQTVRASELLKTIKRVEAEMSELDPPVFGGGVPEANVPEKSCQLICVSSFKRGCGCDTVATSLAAHAAEAGLKVAFIDLGQPPCAGFHFGVPEPASVREPAVYDTKWGTLVAPGDDGSAIFDDVASKHDVVVVCSPNRLVCLEQSRCVVVLDRDIQAVEITSSQIANLNSDSVPVIFVNRASESGRPDAACIFEQKGYEVITAETDTTGCIRALADCKPALTRSPQMAQAIGKLASTLKLLG